MTAEFLTQTPPGKGAIAVVSLFAEDPAKIVSSFFTPRSGRPLGEYPPGEIVYGTIFEEDVLVCPVSENEMEIHCHGSQAAVARLGELLVEQGAQEISREMWIRRNFLEKTENQRLAFQALLGAETEKIARILHDQFDGAFERAVKAGEDTQKWDELACRLTKPWKVVMVGKPNVGKSSLFNRILGFPRAIVYEKAGTTRDILREKTVLDGWNVELVDTAGLHESADEIEREGIRRARMEIESADLILWIREAQERRDASEISEYLNIPNILKEKRLLTVWNKADLVSESEWNGMETLTETEIAVSALQETGLEQLLERIVRTLVPEEPLPGTGIRLCGNDEGPHWAQGPNV